MLILTSQQIGAPQASLIHYLMILELGVLVLFYKYSTYIPCFSLRKYPDSHHVKKRNIKVSLKDQFSNNFLPFINGKVETPNI